MDFSDWIGNSVSSDDVITPRMVDHFQAYAGRIIVLPARRCRPDCIGVWHPKRLARNCLALMATQSAGVFCLKFPMHVGCGQGAGWNFMVISRLVIMSKSKAALMISALNQAKAAIYVLLR